MTPFDFRKSMVAALAMALTGAVSTGPSFAQETERATARLMTAQGEPAGEVSFTQTPNGVLIEVLVTGATPGEHAIHLHETGSCEPDFSAAGDHFNPSGKEHGFFNENGPHAGDLPNIFVGVDGAATAHMTNDRVSLGSDGNGLLDADGTAVIVHAQADTYAAEAGAGDRELCGVVEPYIG